MDSRGPVAQPHSLPTKDCHLDVFPDVICGSVNICCGMPACQEPRVGGEGFADAQSVWREGHQGAAAIDGSDPVPEGAEGRSAVVQGPGALVWLLLPLPIPVRVAPFPPILHPGSSSAEVTKDMPELHNDFERSV